MHIGRILCGQHTMVNAVSNAAIDIVGNAVVNAVGNAYTSPRSTHTTICNNTMVRLPQQLYKQQHSLPPPTRTALAQLLQEGW